MNMKKLMAGVVAGALAVSSLAVAAFADTVSLTKPGDTVYNAEVVYTKTGMVNGGSDLVVPGIAVTAENVTVSKVTVEAQLVCKTSVVTKTKELKVDKNVAADDKFTTTTATASISYDFSNVQDNAEYKLTYTVVLTSGKEIKASDNFALNAEQSGKCTVKANTKKDDAPVGKFSIGIDGSEADFIITRAQARDLGANGGTITYHSYIYGATAAELENANVMPVILKAKVYTNFDKDGITYNVVLNAEGDISFDIPKGYATHAGDEVTDYAKIYVELSQDAAWTGATSSGSAGWGFWGADLVFTSGSTAVETTTAAEETTTTAQVSENTDATTTTTVANNGASNNGASNSGADKNQPTGVVLAVIPAIVAAAGVVVSKKRK